MRDPPADLCQQVEDIQLNCTSSSSYNLLQTLILGKWIEREHLSLQIAVRAHRVSVVPQKHRLSIAYHTLHIWLHVISGIQYVQRDWQRITINFGYLPYQMGLTVTRFCLKWWFWTKEDAWGAFHSTTATFNVCPHNISHCISLWRLARWCTYQVLYVSMLNLEPQASWQYSPPESRYFFELVRNSWNHYSPDVSGYDHYRFFPTQLAYRPMNQLEISG